jgi:hypothetical protein
MEAVVHAADLQDRDGGVLLSDDETDVATGLAGRADSNVIILRDAIKERNLAAPPRGCAAGHLIVGADSRSDSAAFRDHGRG